MLNAAPGTPVFPSVPFVVESLGPWAVEYGLTPGVSSSICVKFRPCVGRSRMIFSSTTLPSSADVVWSSSDCAVTSTVSVAAPTWRVTLRATVWLTSTVKGMICALLKPDSSTVRT